ncbi:MAG: hypothetical protein AAFZ15_34755 [Bacteroidota bacterium]
MKTHFDKRQEIKNRSMANEVTQKQSGGGSVFRFVDNRPQASIQRKLQDIADNSPRAMQFKTFHEMANSSPLMRKAIQLQAMADRYTVRKQADTKTGKTAASLGNVVQAMRYKVGEPPPPGEEDARPEVEAANQGGGVYVSSSYRRYVLDPSGAYLVPIAEAPVPTFSAVAPPRRLFGTGRSQKETFDLAGEQVPVKSRPIYRERRKTIAAKLAGDPVAEQQLRALAEHMDPRHKKYKKNHKRQNRKIRDKAVKRPGDVRGTGNDEGGETFLGTLATMRDAGMTGDPNVRTKSVGKHGQTLTRMDWHEGNRTRTRDLPLVGGPDFNHPGVATRTPGGQDHLNRGNARLDEARAAGILSHHSPASEFGAALVEQVKMTKPPRDIVDPDKVEGFDPQGRDLHTDGNARQDLAWSSGLARELRSRMAKKLGDEYENLSDYGVSELSSDDEAFDEALPVELVEAAVRNPRLMPLLAPSMEHEKPRPKKWKYKRKRSKKEEWKTKKRRRTTG